MLLFALDLVDLYPLGLSYIGVNQRKLLNADSVTCPAKPRDAWPTHAEKESTLTLDRRMGIEACGVRTNCGKGCAQSRSARGVAI